MDAPIEGAAMASTFKKRFRLNVLRLVNLNLPTSNAKYRVFFILVLHVTCVNRIRGQLLKRLPFIDNFSALTT